MALGKILGNAAAEFLATLVGHSKWPTVKREIGDILRLRGPRIETSNPPRDLTEELNHAIDLLPTHAADPAPDSPPRDLRAIVDELPEWGDNDVPGVRAPDA